MWTRASSPDINVQNLLYSPNVALLIIVVSTGNSLIRSLLDLIFTILLPFCSYMPIYHISLPLIGLYPIIFTSFSPPHLHIRVSTLPVSLHSPSNRSLTSKLFGKYHLRARVWKDTTTNPVAGIWILRESPPYTLSTRIHLPREVRYNSTLPST